MREIKFRYIFKDVKENGIALVTQFWSLNNIETNDIVYDNEILIARNQHSGLKDKNGVEIYEGDICRCWGGCEFNGYCEYNKIYEVKWQGSGLEMVMGDCGYGWNYSSAFEHIKVIGNIYENPELLKEKR